MKKLVMTVAVLACAASIVSAQTVTSANIVGYSKEAAAAGNFQLVAAQFNAGTAGGMTLGEAFGEVGDQDQVLFWNGGGYTTYIYWAGWGWYDITGSVLSDDVLIPEGNSVWIKDVSGGGMEVIIAGEVPSASSMTNTLSTGFNAVSNPYPTELRLGDIPLVSLSDGDRALLWNGSSYTTYIYWVGWGWYDITGSILSDDVVVEVGQGFWLDSAAGGELVLTKQY